MSYILDALNKQESDGKPAPSVLTQSSDHPRQRPWLAIAGLALLANAVIAGIWLWRSETPATPHRAAPTDAPAISMDSAPSQPPAGPVQHLQEQPVITFDAMPTPSVEPLTASRPALSQGVSRPGPQQAQITPAPSANSQLTITTQPGEVVISPPGSRPIIIAAENTATTTNGSPANSPELSTTATQSASVPPVEEARQVTQSELRETDPAGADSFVTFAELDGATRARFPQIEVSTHIYAEEADLRAVVFERRRLQEGDTIAGLPLVHITEAGLVVRFEGKLIELSVLDDWEGY